ncbi:LysR family transcriptional regulator [Polaromonas sp.]|jgi:DNA-binding transcriptional LysR family regulator|uniref:LysR family transcriptional regulator n=1 Tax=Polaromonas sp. TaxID=1869339 RepID=UPI001E1471E2|nr:LysR family transcriptional regulator [Polaromonas sp.]MBT9474504.1 LysR family transcriptional regulator [Polaromonas sp.]
MRPEFELLDIKLLRLLDQLYTTRSVTRSAEALGQSQPTVSIWLARLRAQLGDPLFVRTAGGMLPTPRTDALIGTVREVLDGLQRLSQAGAGFEPATAQRRFSICMTDASHITLLPRLLAHVRAVAPGVSLQASRIDAQLAQALQSGEADLAVGFLPWLDTGFYQQTLYAQDWICLANAQHPRVRGAGEKHWNLAVYQQEAHISISSGTGHQLLESAVAAQQITRQLRLELPGFLGLSAILSTSDLIATLPRHIGETLAHAAGPNGLQVLPCPFGIPGFTVKQYWHARYHHDAASRWLRGVCAELFMKSAPSP